MKPVKSTVLALLGAAAIVTSGAALAQHSFERDEASLTRGSHPDVTPQQRYDTAIREAGGAYKESLRDCSDRRGPDHTSCVREAKVTYDHDMAEAKALLRGYRTRGDADRDNNRDEDRNRNTRRGS